MRGSGVKQYKKYGNVKEQEIGQSGVYIKQVNKKRIKIEYNEIKI